jgi:triosephosphate isomerase (TIM)
MKKIIVANWKMNPQTPDEAKGLFEFSTAEAEKYQNIKLIICPPFIYLPLLRATGAQDVFYEEKGAFTGEISPRMLKNLGVEYVLIGHSDRRYVLNETDEIINKKIKACLITGLTPILLAGEKEGEKREEILIRQLSRGLEGLSSGEVSKILFCYEPVWAISTNAEAKPDTPENTLEAVKFIFDFLLKTYNLKLESCLYGGSVNEKNIFDFLKHPEINGAIVGGASLRKQEFANMLKLIS